MMTEIYSCNVRSVVEVARGDEAGRKLINIIETIETQALSSKPIKSSGSVDIKSSMALLLLPYVY